MKACVVPMNNLTLFCGKGKPFKKIFQKVDVSHVLYRRGTVRRKQQATDETKRKYSKSQPNSNVIHFARPLLVSIWAKILAVDTSCQTDLIRESSHKYFLSVLQDDCMMPQHRTWAAFILASIVHNYKEGSFFNTTFVWQNCTPHERVWQ